MLMTFNDLLPDFFIIRRGSSGGFNDVCIDSRSVKKDSLFVSLNGAKTDGHKFVETAFAGGAAAALVEKKKMNTYNLSRLAEKYDRTLIVVENTLKGLQEAAALYLKKFPSMLRIGITGSSGKTTTKEITASIFRCAYGVNAVICNEGNLNSETGMPLSVFNVRSTHKVSIFEMGMNRSGEIRELADILKPQIACITNTGSAHIGCIGSTRLIAQEKKAIFSKFGGGETAIIPEDSSFKDLLCKDVNGKIRYFGVEIFKKDGGVKKDIGLSGTQITLGGKQVNFALPGEHNFKNALAAMEIAKEAGVEINEILEGIANTKALFGRGEVIKGLPYTVVKDCYNSNPQSLFYAIKLMDGEKCAGKKYYVIGSMKELGSETKTEHQNAGSLLEDSKCDFVFLFGEEMIDAASRLHNKKYFYSSDMEELKKEFKKQVKKDDLVLLKGSRACELERLLECS